MERIIAQICREGGGRVRTNVYLRNVNLRLDTEDDRKLEIVVEGLELYAGAQLAIDATLVSQISCNGSPSHGSDANPGAALVAARQIKFDRCHEIITSRRCHLLVAGIET